MPCLGCANHKSEADQRHRSSHYSMTGTDVKSLQRRADFNKAHLQVLEELTETTYGLAVEGSRSKMYEAQDFFAFKEIVGSGVVGVVFRAYFKPTGKAYAVKFIPHFKQSRHFVLRELAVLKMSENCKYIVQYHSHFRVGPNMYFVMEICEGGTLDQLLSPKSIMPPKLGRTFLKELAIALIFLHSAKIVHRDVHMANCLLTNTGHLRLTDFGLSRTVEDPGGEMMTICGKAAIRAPEMYLDKLCGFGLDWWSMGVLLYRFLTGYYPFQTDKLTQGFQYVTKLKEKYPDWLFDDLHSTDFCQRLLEKEQKLRIGYQNENEIKHHSYFMGLDWEGEENIEFVMEQDMKTISRQHIPVYKKLLIILGVHNHPILGYGEGTRDSELSLNLKTLQQSRNIARKLTDFLALSSTAQVKSSHHLRLHSVRSTVL